MLTEDSAWPSLAGSRSLITRCFLGSRDRGDGDKAADSLRRSRLDVSVVSLDLNDAESIGKAIGTIERSGLRVEVLVNNAVF